MERARTWSDVGKESAHNAGDLGLTPGCGRSPGGGHDALAAITKHHRLGGLNSGSSFSHGSEGWVQANLGSGQSLPCGLAAGEGPPF